MWLLRLFGVLMAAMSLFLLAKQGFDISLSSMVGLVLDWYKTVANVTLGWLGPFLEPVLRTISPLIINYDTLRLDLEYDPMKGAQAPFVLTLAMFGALSRGMTNSILTNILLAMWGLFLALVPAVIASTWFAAAIVYIENVYFSVVIFLGGAAVASFVPLLGINQKRVLVALICSLAVVVPLLMLWEPIFLWFYSDEPALIFLLLLWGGLVTVLSLAGLLKARFMRGGRDKYLLIRWLSTTPTQIALELLSVIVAAAAIAASNAGLGLVGL